MTTKGKRLTWGNGHTQNVIPRYHKPKYTFLPIKHAGSSKSKYNNSGTSMFIYNVIHVPGRTYLIYIIYIYIYIYI